MKGNNKGFTLLEILVVISLILIVVGIALPRFTGVGNEGKKAKAAAELKTLQTALESYLTSSGSTLPATGAGTTVVLSPTLEGASPRLVGDVDTFYDPFGATATTPYRYLRGGTTYYLLFSLGPDKANAPAMAISAAGVITNAGDNIYVSNGSI